MSSESTRDGPAALMAAIATECALHFMPDDTGAIERIEVHGLWQAAVRRVAPTIMAALRRGVDEEIAARGL